ncbi:SMI1/KNR4 family protein [Nocardia sp. NPDC003693]
MGEGRTVEPDIGRRPLESGRIDERIGLIRELLDRWAALRPSDSRAWRSCWPPVEEDVVAEFEQRLGGRLPEGYRRYLLEFGEPAQGLMGYGPTPFAEQAGERSGEPFVLDRPWAGWPEQISEWEDEEGEDFFDCGPGEFYGQFEDPRDAFFDLPAGAEATDGTVDLGATRSHIIARLVINGPWAGSVWFDSSGYDGGLMEPAEGEYCYRDIRGEFFDAGEWLPLTETAWFPSAPAGPPDPAPGDFLDLTIEWLRHRVRQAEAEKICDGLDLATLIEARGRLDAPHDFGYPRGHRYGKFTRYIGRLMRDELLGAAPAAGDRILERASALLPPTGVPVALILARRWWELIDFELSAFPESDRSAVNLALAAIMLDTEPSFQAAPGATSPQRTGFDRWAVLDTLARAEPDLRRRFVALLPETDAVELAPLLEIATLDITPDALDTLLAADPSASDRTALTVLLTRALHADDNPAPGLAERLCALAVAADRLGEVFDQLNAVAGQRWRDRWEAHREGQRRLDSGR